MVLKYGDSQRLEVMDIIWHVISEFGPTHVEASPTQEWATSCDSCLVKDVSGLYNYWPAL